MAPLLLPLLVHVGLTFTLLVITGLRRRSEAKADRSLLESGRLDGAVWSRGAQAVANNYANQFQLPVLFYLGALIVLLDNDLNEWTAFLAWLFVASRIVHTVIHTTTNYLPHRFYAFLAGVVFLIGMWVSIIPNLASLAAR